MYNEFFNDDELCKTFRFDKASLQFYHTNVNERTKYF
jgi:hypothetical protein